MQPGLWTSLIMMIPGVRAAFRLAEEKRLEAAHFQGQILALQSRLDALSLERHELNREKDNAYKLVVNVFSQYAWGVKQFQEVGGMPEQFHPQEGILASEAVNASSLTGPRNKRAMEEMEEYFKERP
jgi:hypothetical protein